MERTIYNPLYKDSITFVKTSHETDGEFSEFILTVMPGGGNPVHIHEAHRETFTTITGILGLTNGDKKISVKPGESVTIDKGVKHNFFNNSGEPCEVAIVFRPGHEGIEKALRIGYGLARDGKTNSKGVPHNPLVAALLFEISETNMPGIFSFLNPLMKMLATRARKKGIEKKLLDTYCK
jgi:mannose-6-phosphate isomerase-like protein (cupin superfamily)